MIKKTKNGKSIVCFGRPALQQLAKEAASVISLLTDRIAGVKCHTNSYRLLASQAKVLNANDSFETLEKSLYLLAPLSTGY